MDRLKGVNIKAYIIWGIINQWCKTHKKDDCDIKIIMCIVNIEEGSLHLWLINVDLYNILRHDNDNFVKIIIFSLMPYSPKQDVYFLA